MTTSENTMTLEINGLHVILTFAPRKLRPLSERFCRIAMFGHLGRKGVWHWVKEFAACIVFPR